jgi:D-alanine-D-alanine ligase
MPLARDKVRTKFLLRGAGLPSADFVTVTGLPAPACSLSWPVIVKPGLQDASVGLDHASVVKDPEHLDQRINFLLRKYGPPVLVEEYIAGREINVALWETHGELRFSAGEIVFRDRGAGFWPIVTYASKWHTGSEDDRMTRPRYPADLAPALRARLGALAIAAFRLLGCRDYARVDFRVRPPDEPFILEVNPNPAINADDGFANCLKAAGISHAEFLVQLTRTALARR